MFMLFTLLLLVYTIKSVIALRCNGGWAWLAFGLLLMCVMPIVWWLARQTDSGGTTPLGIYLGTPIALLPVPSFSFLVDIARAPEDRGPDWWWRYPLEIFLAAPAWLVIWVYFEFLVLGWCGNDL
jgi:hypothetical protein